MKQQDLASSSSGSEALEGAEMEEFRTNGSSSDQFDDVDGENQNLVKKNSGRPKPRGALSVLS